MGEGQLLQICGFAAGERARGEQTQRKAEDGGKKQKKKKKERVRRERKV